MLISGPTVEPDEVVSQLDLVKTIGTHVKKSHFAILATKTIIAGKVLNIQMEGTNFSYLATTSPNLQTHCLKTKDIQP
jgi:hypothetical protein